jgi:protein phosphatase
MGGLLAGEVASQMAVRMSLEQLQIPGTKWGFKLNQCVKISQHEARVLFEILNESVREIDRSITYRSEQDGRHQGMGTTLTMAFSVGIDLFIFHLGDSRAYLRRNHELTQLTEDHTVAQAMADSGYIAADEVSSHERRNELTNYLGGLHGRVRGDVRWLRLADGDRLLLCSDGLNDMVDDASIARILDKYDTANAAANALLEEALNRGGRDNVTVIVAGYKFPALESAGQREVVEDMLAPDSTSIRALD